MRFGYEPTSEQDAFDFLVRRSREMPRQCKISGTCALRDRSWGNACFAGQLMTNEELKETMRRAEDPDRVLNDTVSSMVRNRRWPARLRPYEGLVRRIQEHHDDEDNWEEKGNGPALPEKMGDSFHETAIYYGFDTSVVREVYPELFRK